MDLIDKYNSMYYRFLDKNNIDLKTVFYSSYYNEGSYYYSNKESFDYLLLSVFDTGFKKKLYKKESFIEYVQKYEDYGFDLICKLEEELVKFIQEKVDMFFLVKRFHFIGRHDFYSDYIPFEDIEDFHIFIIKSISENIDFSPYDIGYSDKDDYYLIKQYYRKVVIKIREKNYKSDKSLLSKELNRLKIEKIDHEINHDKLAVDFLDFCIGHLESIYQSSISPFSNKEIDIEKLIELKKTLRKEELEEYFIDFIKSSNYGNRNEIDFFLKEEKKMSSLEKIKYTLNHRERIKETAGLYLEVSNFIERLIDNKKHEVIRGSECSISSVIDNEFDKAAQICVHYDNNLSWVLSNAVLLIHNKYSLSKPGIKISKSNEDLLMLLPLIVDFRKWKEIISGLFSQIDTIEEKEILKNKLIGLLLELSEQFKESLFDLYRIVINAENLDDYPKDKNFQTKLTSFYDYGFEEKIEINDYMNFLTSSTFNYPKLQLSSQYRQSQILDILTSFKENTLFKKGSLYKNIDFYDFIYYYTTSNQKSNSDLKYKKEKIDNNFSKENRLELLSLLKYLDNKGLIKVTKRSLGEVIQSYYSKDKNGETTVWTSYSDSKNKLEEKYERYLNNLIDQLKK